jgi:hypothetical protein
MWPFAQVVSRPVSLALLNSVQSESTGAFLPLDDHRLCGQRSARATYFAWFASSRSPKKRTIVLYASRLSGIHAL